MRVLSTILGLCSVLAALTTTSSTRAATPLVINELMASNGTTLRNSQGQYEDWIEILNPTTSNIDLAGMYLTDDLSSPTHWKFPAGTVIPGGGYFLIWLDGGTAGTGLHAGFKLGVDGETVALFDRDGKTLIDSVTSGRQVADVSYGRSPDGSGPWGYMTAPTPGKANSGLYQGRVADVQYSHGRGFYDLPFDLEMTCPTAGATVYYTVDGSSPIEGNKPSSTAEAYTEPAFILTTTCIRAGAIKAGWLSSSVSTHTYLFDMDEAQRSMAVVCLVGDEHKSLFEPNGIMAIVGGYYSGEVWQSSGAGSYNNPIHRGRAYERPVSLEVLDAKTGLCLQTDCGIRVHGSDYTRPRYTRGEDWLTCWNGSPGFNRNKFSFNLYFRETYGLDRLDCSLFPFIDVDRFQSVALRGGHNDACAPFVKDEWARRLFREMGGVQVTGTFANLYLNGSYKGYYNPTSRLDQEFLQEWYHSDKEFDVITQAGLREGSLDAWNALLSYADTHNLANTADYDYVAARLDIPLFVDFLILEIYIANFDWPGNNWDVHRERSETGVFRFSVWDAEGLAETWAVGSNYDLTAFEDYPTWASPRGLNNMEGDPSCRLYRSLRANPRFTQLFADHVQRHFRNNGILTPAHLLGRWWEVFGEVSGALPETQQYPVRFVPDQFIPNREAHVLAAFDRNGLFDQDFGAPAFQINGSPQHGGQAQAGDSLTLSNPNASGAVYYTLDGTDPALPGTPAQQVLDAVLVAENAAKRVLVPTAAVAEAWKGGAPFNDAGWTAVTGSPGGVGYERDTGYQSYLSLDVGSPMYNKVPGCYVRIPFTLAQSPSSLELLALRIRYDDGFVAYLNGVEVQRMLVNGTPAWNSLASGGHESAGLETFDLSSSRSLLRGGQNVLALHGMNNSLSSSDFIVSAELVAGRSRPASAPQASGTGIAYKGPIPLDRSVRVKARVMSNQALSGLEEAAFSVGPVRQGLRISEILYHPLDTGDPLDPNLEFVEMTNVGQTPLNLNMVRFGRGIDYTFGDVSLGPGGCVLVVKDKAAFLLGYPGLAGLVAGQYSGSLDNAGERITLLDAADQTILDFTYRDDWYDATDGKGRSLTVRDPQNADPAAYGSKATWQASVAMGGSPGSI